MGSRHDSSGGEPGVAKAGEGPEAKEAEVVAAHDNVGERSFVASVRGGVGDLLFFFEATNGTRWSGRFIIFWRRRLSTRTPAPQYYHIFFPLGSGNFLDNLL